MDLVRVMRLWAFLLVGVLLGGGCSVAMAATVLWVGGSSMVVRSSEGVIRAISFASPWEPGPAGSGGGAASVSSARSVVLAGAGSAALTGSRAVGVASIAAGALKLARAAGPASLAISLAAPLVYDAVTDWWNLEEPATTPSHGYWLYQFYGNQYGYKSPGNCDPPSHSCGNPGTLGWCPDGGVNTAITWGGQSFYACLFPGTAPAPTTRPATDAEVTSGIQDYINNGGNGPGLLRKLKDHDIPVDAGPENVSGPSSVPGPSTTKTTSGPAGQTTTVTNTTYNFDYAGNTVTINTTNQTTTTNPDGTQETSTETKNGVEEPAPPEEPKDLCTEHPDASACEELGDPQDEEVQNEERSVSWSQEGGAAGSCPADKPVALPFGQSASLSWQPVCDFATGVRPFVIGAAWLSAGLFLFQVARGRA